MRNAGACTGKLANSGETLVVTAANGAPILTITYGDTAPWPIEADGTGSSLTLVRPGTRPDSNNALHWRASTISGGTPGGTDATTFTGTPTADADHDGLLALLEYATGTSDLTPNGSPIAATSDGMDLLITIPVNGAAEDITLTPEYSTQLTAWTAATVQLHAATATTRTWRLTPPAGPRVFVRVSAAQ